MGAYDPGGSQNPYPADAAINQPADTVPMGPQPYLPDAGRPADPAPQESDFAPAGGYDDVLSDLRFNPFGPVPQAPGAIARWNNSIAERQLAGQVNRLSPSAIYDPQSMFDRMGGGGYDPTTGQILSTPDQLGQAVMRNTPEWRRAANTDPVHMDYIPENDPSLTPEQRDRALQERRLTEANRPDEELRAGLKADWEQMEKARLAHEKLANEKTEQDAQMYEKLAADLQKHYQQEDQLREQAQDFRQQQADQLRTDDMRIQQWAMQQPTRNAVYAATMHITPTLAIMAAIGGALTRTSAIAMLGATNGIVQGVTQGNENLYRDSMNKWQAGYDAIKAHMKNMHDVYQGYIDSYEGRADARELAAEHTRRVTGDRITANQLRISNSANLLEEQGKQIDRMEKNRLTLARIDEAKQMRENAAGQESEFVKNMQAQQLARGGRWQDVVGGRGKYNLALQEDLYDRAGKFWVNDHRDDTGPGGQPLYRRADGSYDESALARAAGDQMLVARSNAQAFQHAQDRAANLAGTLQGVANTMENLLPGQLALAKMLDQQGLLRPYNKLKLDWGLRTSNRLVNQFVMQHESLATDFQILSNRGRVGTVEERDRKWAKWNEADSYEAYEGEARIARQDSLGASAGYIQAAQRQNYDPNLSRVPMTVPNMMSPDYLTNPEIPFGAQPTMRPPAMGGGAAAGMGGGGAGYGGADFSQPGPGGPNSFGSQLPPGFKRDQ